MPRLSQILTTERGIKTRVNTEVDQAYKQLQKPTLFEGFSKSYQITREGEDEQPPQQQRVQFTVHNVVKTVATRLAELFDVTAQKDWANTEAKADVVVDDKVMVAQVPTTFLLFLEKQLEDLRTMVSKTPTLDMAEDWEWDPGKELFKTKPHRTARTKKIPKPVVLYPATEQHPAQTQLLNEDVTVGEYLNIKLSGAIEDRVRREWLQRIEKLQQAVKHARDKANQVDAPRLTVGETVMEWIFQNGHAR